MTRFDDLTRGWDEVLGADSFADLRNASSHFARFLEPADGEAPTLAALNLSPALRHELADAHRAVTDRFLEDPDEYVDPMRYLDQTQAYGQPSVLLLYRLPEGGTGWADVTPPSWQPTIQLKNALQLATRTELADALFLPGDKSLQIEGRDTLRKILGLQPVRLIR